MLMKLKHLILLLEVGIVLLRHPHRCFSVDDDEEFVAYVTVLEDIRAFGVVLVVEAREDAS